MVAVLLLSCGLRASVDPYDVVVVEDPTNATVLFRTTVALPYATDLRLLDDGERVIYQQTVAAGAFVNLRLRRNGIPVGNYTLVFTDEKGKTECPFAIVRNALAYDFREARQTIYPRVDLRDERLLVVNYDNDSGKRVNVRLTNEAGREVFSDKVAGESIRRSYQLNELAAGTYTVTVSSTDVKNYTAAIALY